MHLRLRPALIALLAVVAAIGGCTLPGPEVDPRPSDPDVRRPPSGAAELERFYDQDLTWRPCRGSQCSTLEVPLDYAKPDGSTIRISLLRKKAKGDRDQRLGSVVVNPGGPGASGVDYAVGADFIVGKEVRRRYDVVGFDPRGVARSAPVDCVDDRSLDRVLGEDPVPDTDAERASLLALTKVFATGCESKSGQLLAHVSTEDAARDLDVLRAALGDKQLNFLGKSYGTYLGATYAGLFPERVGRFVLDGVLPPDIGVEEMNRGQAEGFERATRAWAQSCVASGECPVGGSVDQVMSGLREVLASVDREPVPVEDPHVRRLTVGWASMGVAEAMYNKKEWPRLTKALADLTQDRNGQELLGLGLQYARRSANGDYQGNLLEAINAVNCLDRPVGGVAEVERGAAALREVAPTWGEYIGWASLVCAVWPVRSTHEPAKISAEGSGPIVVVGTTRDPATPYEWSVRLRDQLANASLVTWDGDGHTAYMRGSRCVQKPIDEYYVRGTVPQDGLRC